MARKNFGWVPDRPDFRDRLHKPAFIGELPPMVDWRPIMPAVYNQGALGSCTSQAICAAIQYDRLKAGEAPDFVPSRLMLYWNERCFEGSINYDSGAQLRDGMRAAAEAGVCAEGLWPYEIAKFTVKPPRSAWNAARLHKLVSYEAVPQALDSMRATLASGYPFVLGFMVYESFETQTVKNTGIVPMPGLFESALGGHAILVVGYDDAAQTWTVRNSWGAEWGDEGYFHVPYDYFTNPNLASDLWVARFVRS